MAIRHGVKSSRELAREFLPYMCGLGFNMHNPYLKLTQRPPPSSILLCSVTRMQCSCHADVRLIEAYLEVAVRA